MTAPNGGGGLTNGNEMAGWVKAVGTLGTTGALIVIAFYLVYSVVENPNYLESQRAILQSIQDNRASLDQHIRQADQSNDDLRALLRRICINTAADASMRDQCFRPAE